MKIKCPKCKEAAELADDFSFVRCPHCSLDMTYGEYVRIIVQNDSTYTDILEDYAGSSADSTSSTLDDWEKEAK